MNSYPDRANTPELNIISSQYRLEKVLEMENPFDEVPPHIIDEYKTQGLIFTTEEGKLMLASPMKTYKKNE